MAEVRRHELFGSTCQPTWFVPITPGLRIF
jgi:hypothetical protein